jgi:PAS domain S-box-containing protein
LHSAQPSERRDELLRRFVEAARRAQIVTIVNLARSEAELGELFTAELCEVFEAEIAFVLAERHGAAPTLIGAHGLTPDQRTTLLEDERFARSVAGEGPQLHDDDPLDSGLRRLALVPFSGEVERGVVGVARLYDERFDKAELALLEAVVESVKHALERLRLGEERDVLLAREQTARREAEATAERLARLQSVTSTVLSELPLERMLHELLERLRELVSVDAAVILLANGGDGLAVQAAAGDDAHVRATVELARREGGNGRAADDHRTLVAVPMAVEGRTMGALVVNAPAPREFSDDDSRLLGLAADRAAIAIENARLYREAEERGQAARVLGYVADGVFLVDAEGVVQLWNPAAEAITGVSAHAALGRPVEAVIPGWGAVVQAVTIARAPAASTGPATTVPVDIDGHELWLSVAGVSFAEGTVFAIRDLTEERHLDELKADFIATVSHELRTPIAAVHGAAKTLEREDVVFTDDLRRRFLSVISEQSERLVKLVNDILLTSQVESGALVLANEEVDVADVAHRVIEAARMHAPHELSFALEAPSTLGPVATDRDKLRQVLTNLVANAVKYSGGSGRIDVRLEQRDGHLLIAVRDEGVGVPLSEQHRIFEKFYRVDPSMSRGVGGTGLGLYICRELVRRLGGSIWVESSEGIGSTFFVELPLAANQGVLAGGARAG